MNKVNLEDMIMSLQYSYQHYSSGTYVAIQIVDVDQDGRPEILAGNQSSMSLEIWEYNSVTNSLNLANSIPFSYHIHDFQVADFDKDGDLDIAAGLRFYGLQYARNDGGGNWAVTSIDGSYSWRIQVGDFDQDGNLDILDGIDGGLGLKIFYGNGSGGFTEGTAPIFGSRGLGVSVADVNNDGRLDIIGVKEAASYGELNELKVFLNLGNRAWSNSLEFPPISEGPLRTFPQENIVVGDVNSDGYLDCVVSQYNNFLETPNNPSQVLLLKGGASGSELTWEIEHLDTLPIHNASVGFANFNDDGHLDIYATGFWDTSVFAYLGDGAGNFIKETIPLNASGPYFHGVAVGDINGDGSSDIVVGQTTGNWDSGNGFQLLLQQNQDPPYMGTPGDDMMKGTTGADTMIGLGGNDIYTVNHSGDVVFESADEGTDAIKASVTYALPDHVENLTLLGTGNLDGTGNGLNNKLTGNNGDNVLKGGASNDILDGKAGNDRLRGGLGDDIYLYRHPGSVIVENVNKGMDTVKAYFSYGLGENLENLTLMGADDLDGIGNSLNNKLTGNSGDNLLNGGAGADIVTGKGGADTFIFNFSQSLVNAPDWIKDFTLGQDKIDLLTQGGRNVKAPVSFTRAADSKALTLTEVMTQVFTDANGTLEGNQALGVNSAALVKVTTADIRGTYLVINNNNLAFQADQDLLINLTGLNGALPDFGAIAVDSFFV